MAISLTDANGNNISSFGSGSSQWATGARTNEATFGQQNLFGTGFASPGQTPITATRANSTSDLGYQDLAESSPGVHAMPMQAAAPGAQPRQLTAGKGVKPDIGGVAGQAVEKRWGTPDSNTPASKPGASSEQGTSAGKPAAGSQMADDINGAIKGVGNLGKAAWRNRPGQYPTGRNENFEAGQTSSTPGGGFGGMGESIRAAAGWPAPPDYNAQGAGTDETTT